MATVRTRSICQYPAMCRIEPKPKKEQGSILLKRVKATFYDANNPTAIVLFIGRSACSTAGNEASLLFCVFAYTRHV